MMVIFYLFIMFSVFDGGLAFVNMGLECIAWIHPNPIPVSPQHNAGAQQLVAKAEST